MPYKPKKPHVPVHRGPVRFTYVSLRLVQQVDLILSFPAGEPAPVVELMKGIFVDPALLHGATVEA